MSGPVFPLEGGTSALRSARGTRNTFWFVEMSLVALYLECKSGQLAVWNSDKSPAGSNSPRVGRQWGPGLVLVTPSESLLFFAYAASARSRCTPVGWKVTFTTGFGVVPGPLEEDFGTGAPQLEMIGHLRRSFSVILAAVDTAWGA